jgi:hypothetical protein
MKDEKILQILLDVMQQVLSNSECIAAAELTDPLEPSPS